jgi:hypothetical protein
MKLSDLPRPHIPSRCLMHKPRAYACAMLWVWLRYSPNKCKRILSHMRKPAFGGIVIHDQKDNDYDKQCKPNTNAACQMESLPGPCKLQNEWWHSDTHLKASVIILWITDTSAINCFNPLCKVSTLQEIAWRKIKYVHSIFRLALTDSVSIEQLRRAEILSWGSWCSTLLFPFTRWHYQYQLDDIS